MVNINIKIPKELHKQIKSEAIMKDKKMKDYIIDLLQQGLK